VLADAAAEAFAEDAPTSVPGMALAIYRPDGERVFLGVYGDFDPEERFAVASANKLVTSQVLLRLIVQSFLELSSTTGAVLGWSGPRGRNHARAVAVVHFGIGARCGNRVQGARVDLIDCRRCFVDHRMGASLTLRADWIGRWP